MDDSQSTEDIRAIGPMILHIDSGLRTLVACEENLQRVAETRTGFRHVESDRKFLERQAEKAKVLFFEHCTLTQVWYKTRPRGMSNYWSCTWRHLIVLTGC